MLCQTLFSGKKIRKILPMLSAKIACRVFKVKQREYFLPFQGYNSVNSDKWDSAVSCFHVRFQYILTDISF